MSGARIPTEAASGLPRPLRDRLRAISRHCASLPRVRNRSEEEILGYGERGGSDFVQTDVTPAA